MRSVYRKATVFFGMLSVALGVALVVRTAVNGVGVGLLIGALFIGLGVGRMYLMRRR